MFLHANLVHLLYNLYALFLFGNILEDNTNSRVAFVTMMLGGIVGNIGFRLFSSSPALGFSGSVYALIGAVTLLMPNLKIPLPIGFIAIPVPVKFAGPLMALGELALSIASSDNIAHTAHLSGFLVGLLIIKIYNSLSSERVPQLGKH